MTTVANLLARIAALHPSDRQWLLAQASAETRARLTVALEAAQAVEPDNGRPVVHRGALSARDIVASATPEQVARALRAEPAWLAAVLLQMDDWPWSAALLKHIPFMQRPMPVIGQAVPTLKPALAAAILKGFAQSLTLIETSAIPLKPRLPPFEALVQRFRTSRSLQEPGF
jgi:hypothetical protein